MSTARPYRSGYCDPPGPHDRHRHCRGFHTANPSGTPVPCVCDCHLEVPVPDPEEKTPDNIPANIPAPDGGITDWLTMLRGAADGLDGEVTEAALRDVDWTDALRHLADLRDTIATLRQIDALLVRHVYLTGEHGKTVIDGLGEVNVSRSRDRRKWDERGVAQAVIDKRMEARGGEMPNDPWEVAEWLLEVYGVQYVRVTPLRAMGLNPKMFCEDEPGNLQVTLPPR